MWHPNYGHSLNTAAQVHNRISIIVSQISADIPKKHASLCWLQTLLLSPQIANYIEIESITLDTI
jgi:hypothetical protein